MRGKTPDPADGFACANAELVDAFLAAARDGDFDALLAVLDGDVVLHVDAAAAGSADDDPWRARGGRQCARLLRPTRGSPSPRWWTAPSASSSPPRGSWRWCCASRVVGDKITEIDIDADPQRLRRFSLAVLG